VATEIRDVLGRRKFRRYLTDEERSIILALLTDAAVWVEPTLGMNDCRDAKDNKYLALAAAAGGEIIVLGNNGTLARSSAASAHRRALAIEPTDGAHPQLAVGLVISLETILMPRSHCCRIAVRRPADGVLCRRAGGGG